MQGLQVPVEKKRLNWKKRIQVSLEDKKVHTLNLFLLMISAGSPKSPDLPHKVPFSGEQGTVAAVEINTSQQLPVIYNVAHSSNQICSLTSWNGQIFALCKERILLLQITAVKCWTLTYTFWGDCCIWSYRKDQIKRKRGNFPCIILLYHKQSINIDFRWLSVTSLYH